MGANSKIEWTDHTFNPWRGCTKVHEGCAHCYAERDSKRFPDIRGIWGPNGTRVVASANSWREPHKWNRDAEATGVRARVFCASLADVFEEFAGRVVNHHGDRWISCPACGVMGQCSDSETCPQCGRKDAHWVTLDDLRQELFALIDRTPWLDWLLVTKRPENIRRMWPLHHQGWDDDRGTIDVYHRENVWLLTSVSNQETADKQIPELLKCRDLVPVLGLSAEPLLGPIDARDWLKARWMPDRIVRPFSVPVEYMPVVGIDWIIAGGEGGPGARPMHPDWARGLRDQCQAAGVAFFFKQWGEWEPSVVKVVSTSRANNRYCPMPGASFGQPLMHRVGKAAAGRLLDGREWSEFPKAAEVAAR